MYHIKDDKRTYRSACLICCGLADKLKLKIYSEISITDICTVSGVSRATFYRLFDTLDDVLSYQFDNLFKQSLDHYCQNSAPEKSYIRIILEFAMRNKPLITAIVDSGRFDILAFSTKGKEEELMQKIGIQISAQERSYYTPTLNYIAFATLSTWVKSGGKETPEQLYGLLKRELAVICKHI